VELLNSAKECLRLERTVYKNKNRREKNIIIKKRVKIIILIKIEKKYRDC
jgi:hypothetical protein